jgi:hypothetical protein
MTEIEQKTVVKPAVAVKNKNLISFDEEDGEDRDYNANARFKKRGIKSMHETDGKGLSTQAAIS